jgi:RecB family exonuclease
MATMLRGYLTWEASENVNTRKDSSKALRTAVDAHEVAFDGLEFKRAGLTVRFRGSIDRVEVEHDEVVPKAGWVAAVDYKTTKWSVPGSGAKAAWGEQVVLQVPLYAWALEQLRPGSKAARIEYRALKNPSIEHPLRLLAVNRKKKTFEENADERAKLETALDAVAQHVTEARAGRFPVRPAPSCGCPSWCPGWDICRVPGGPTSLFP